MSSLASGPSSRQEDWCLWMYFFPKQGCPGTAASAFAGSSAVAVLVCGVSDLLRASPWKGAVALLHNYSKLQVIDLSS